MFEIPCVPLSGLRRRLCCLCVFIFALAGTTSALAQKTDVVYLTNGDRITGDVKRLERGRLLVKTQSMGSIYLEWTAVEQVVSDKHLQLELTDGRRVLGSLHRAFGSQISVATVFGETEELLVESVVQSGADTKRGNIGGSDRNYLENHWFWTGLANIDRNDELGIDSRFSAGGGGG